MYMVLSSLKQNSCQINFVLVHKTRSNTSKVEESLILWGEGGNMKLNGIAPNFW